MSFDAYDCIWSLEQSIEVVENVYALVTQKFD